jgi:hypothetical protein
VSILREELCLKRPVAAPDHSSPTQARSRTASTTMSLGS